MHGISTQSKEQIHRAVGELFDKAALRLVGPIPKLHHKKVTLLGFLEGVTLASLFVQAMNNKWLNHIEQDVVKGILEGAYNYVEVLKNKTSNTITERIDGLARQSRISGQKISEQTINRIIEEEMTKAKSDLERIASSESTKARNLGAIMDITRKASALGEKDPIVYFNVIRDNSTCETCIKLYLMPDKVTPRLYRMSELNAGYYKRGDSMPSILGSHPRCRCTPASLPSDWGFNKKGHISFIGVGHDELSKQRKE